MQDSINGPREEDVRRHGSLEIEQDLAAQKRLWRVQRIVRRIAAVILLFALAGLFGDGPLSHERIEKSNHVVEYERIVYRDSRQTIRITIPRESFSSGKASLWWDRSSVDQSRIEKITPEPKETKLSSDRVVLEFDVVDDPGPFVVRIDFENEKMGLMKSQLGIDRGPTFDLAQFVLP